MEVIVSMIDFKLAIFSDSFLRKREKETTAREIYHLLA
jgi:hypothetical protein